MLLGFVVAVFKNYSVCFEEVLKKYYGVLYAFAVCSLLILTLVVYL